MMVDARRKGRLRMVVAGKSADELRTRSLQGIQKRLDVFLYLSGIGFGTRKSRTWTQRAGHFFFVTEDLPSIAQLLQAKLPEEAEKIVTQAEQICRHRFHLLGYESLDYGAQIDWHLDLVHGKRAPLRPWFKVRYLDFSEVGDHKVIWELNRHQHLVTLAKAFQLTRDERFATEAVQQWQEWHRSNPYPLGINWASSLEVAFRSLSWLWVKHLLADSSVMSTQFPSEFSQLLEISGRHIERYLSTYFSPNTHLLGEGVALFFIGSLCPGFPAAERWKRLGWQIVLRESERQVQPDGMYFEQSVYYHVYALDFFLHARVLAERNNIAVPAEFDRTIEKMLDALLLLAQAGSVPSFGDDDGGRVFNPCRNRAEHMTDPLSTGAVMFGRPDFKAAAGKLRGETLWMLGAEGVARFERLPTPELDAASGRLESSGFCVMASAGRRAEKLVIDGGLQGHGNAGHGHADALSLTLFVNGTLRLLDPGTGCYVSQMDDRERFRGTASHNTLQVDGKDQAVPSGPFAWKDLPRVNTDCWVTGNTFDYFSARHDGYCRLPDPVTHCRRVFYLKQRFWLVHDLAEGNGTHRLELHWHVAPGITHISSCPRAVVLQGSDGQSLALMPAHSHGWQQEIASSRVSPAYGCLNPGIVLRYSTVAVLPAEIATLVLPLEVAKPGQSELGHVTVLGAESSDDPVRGYLHERPGERHSVFFASGSRIWTAGTWESDAELLYCGISETGQLHLVLCNGSFANWNGKRVLSCAARIERWEVLSSESRVKEFCSEEAASREVNLNTLPGIESVHAEVLSRKEAG